MEIEYKGLDMNVERLNTYLKDEKSLLIFKIGYKLGYEKAVELYNELKQ